MFAKREVAQRSLPSPSGDGRLFCRDAAWGGATIATRRWKRRPSADGLEREPCATNTDNPRVGHTSFPDVCKDSYAVTLSVAKGLGISLANAGILRPSADGLRMTTRSTRGHRPPLDPLLSQEGNSAAGCYWKSRRTGERFVRYLLARTRARQAAPLRPEVRGRQCGPWAVREPPLR